MTFPWSHGPHSFPFVTTIARPAVAEPDPLQIPPGAPAATPFLARRPSDRCALGSNRPPCFGGNGAVHLLARQARPVEGSSADGRRAGRCRAAGTPARAALTGPCDPDSASAGAPLGGEGTGKAVGSASAVRGWRPFAHRPDVSSVAGPGNLLCYGFSRGTTGGGDEPGGYLGERSTAYCTTMAHATHGTLATGRPAPDPAVRPGVTTDATLGHIAGIFGYTAFFLDGGHRHLGAAAHHAAAGAAHPSADAVRRPHDVGDPGARRLRGARAGALPARRGLHRGAGSGRPGGAKADVRPGSIGPGDPGSVALSIWFQRRVGYRLAHGTASTGSPTRDSS